MGSHTPDILILGAGISGLSAAFRLHQQQQDLLVAERAERVGGVITTRAQDGFRWEEGPNSFTPSPALLNLIADAGIADRLLWADGKLPRFVYLEGKLTLVPMTPPDLIKSNLLSFGAKLRALLGILGFTAKAPDKEETVEEFFARQLGPQVVERLVGPFTSGVYAGDTQQLSATAAFSKVADLERKYGSIIAGIIRSPKSPKPPISAKIDPLPKRGQLGNFVEGLQELPDAIAQQLGDAVKLQWEAAEIVKEGDRYRTTFQTPSGPQTVSSKAILLAVPAYRAAPLLKSLDTALADELAAIPYPHVGAVTLAYPADALPQPFAGFGQLFPRGQGIRTLGTIWTSSLFPGRAPAGYQCTLSYIGGATDPDIAQMTDEALARTVHQDLSKTLLVKEAEPRVMGVRRWPRAIPQYTLGHRQRLARIDELLADYSGLVLCTNYLDGVALGDCVRRGEARAADLVEWLAQAE
ncbi:protoporphyrinogen oxidase [Synechococcus sp. PCC 7336]|uniref:protoporphyrinogen oxidase n=1 Tax=Synechococcus sp. PCC 7336 TaxID=195250 RepID=UPI00034A3522|nr:protoporphyrinogen oxidase [Synechococcus sp. PCC 7336]